MQETFVITKENFNKYKGKWIVQKGKYPSLMPVKVLSCEEDRFKTLVIGLYNGNFERDEFFGYEWSLATEEDFKNTIKFRINDKDWRNAVDEYKEARNNLRYEIKRRRETTKNVLNALRDFKGE